MSNDQTRPNITISLGDGWKMTLTKVSRFSSVRLGANEETMDTWCGAARTIMDAVTIYDDIEPNDSVARAEVIFESRWQRRRGQWHLEYPGRTFYDGCPASGEDGEAEKALFEVVPVENVLTNILVLAQLATEGQPLDDD